MKNLYIVEMYYYKGKIDKYMFFIFFNFLSDWEIIEDLCIYLKVWLLRLG